MGKAAQATGLSAKAVRLYEAKGLLPTAERTEAGYRTYTDDDLAVLRLIRQAKTLGLSPSEIRDILELRRGVLDEVFAAAKLQTGWEPHLSQKTSPPSPWTPEPQSRSSSPTKNPLHPRRSEHESAPRDRCRERDNLATFAEL